MITSKTPYRLSLFGGGTDYPDWFSKHPSVVISAAMANYCYVSIKKLPPFFDHKYRISYSKIEHAKSIEDIDHPAIRSCLSFTNILDGLSIHYDGDLPARSGIGSSSSFTVGLLTALNEYNMTSVEQEIIAKNAIYVEQKIIGENVGIQDQIMAAMGGIRLIHMGPGNVWSTSDLQLPSNYIHELESNIMLGFSGVSRVAEVQAKKQVDNIKNNTSTGYLEDMSAISEQALEYFLKKQEVYEIGKLFRKNWELKRKLADGITDRWIDNIYENAIDAGAFGGKLMGAGGGGFFMFLVPKHKQDSVKERLKNDIKVWIPFKFDFNGTKIISSEKL